MYCCRGWHYCCRSWLTQDFRPCALTGRQWLRRSLPIAIAGFYRNARFDVRVGPCTLKRRRRLRLGISDVLWALVLVFPESVDVCSFFSHRCLLVVPLPAVRVGGWRRARRADLGLQLVYVLLQGLLQQSLCSSAELPSTCQQCQPVSTLLQGGCAQLCVKTKPHLKGRLEVLIRGSSGCGGNVEAWRLLRRDQRVGVLLSWSSGTALVVLFAPVSCRDGAQARHHAAAGKRGTSRIVSEDCGRARCTRTSPRRVQRYDGLPRGPWHCFHGRAISGAPTIPNFKRVR